MTANETSCRPSQETVLEICSQVLHRPLAHLELDRSFLAHGGDSLIAIQLITRARKAGLSVTLQELLQSESLRTLCEKVLARNIKLSRLRNKPRGLADIAKTGNLEKDPSSSPHFPDLAKHIGPISLSNVEDVFTCTKSQEAMLAAQARDPCLYQCFVAIKLTSTNQPIDVSLLEAIWKRIVDRQSFLKVVFISSASRIGGFDQVQLKHFHPPLKVLRSSETSEASFCKPLPVTFEPYQPLHQLSILQPSDHDALCKLEFSHALIDGSSAELLLNDLLSTYNGKHNTNPTLSRYDLHRFQNRAILDDYWGTYLKDVQMTQFPLSNPDAEAGNLSTVSCDVVIDIETIREFSNKHAVTISQICQVAWGLVLRIFTSTPDVCFSYVSSGRDIPVPGIEGAAGCFVNLLPCRLQLDGSNNVIRVLNKLKEDFVQSIPYHHVAMNRRGNLATKHGNTIMSFMHRTHEPLGGTGINYKFVTRYVPTDFDIAIYVEVHEARFNIELDFWSSKIDTLFAERIGQTFAKAIFSIVSRPQDKIKDLNMLGGLDRFQLGQWNNHQPQPNKGLLHDLVHSQSLTSLGSIAVQSWDGALTYQELDSNAQRLASFLVSLGVKPEVKVALSFAKSIWAVVSQLAVLKAGGAVVSLGISNPLYQLRRIMEDSEATILLVGYTQAMRLSGFAQRVITVDTTLMNNLPDSRFSSLVKPNNCAWIIYTSGSTGNPKGVVLEHTTLCSTIMAHGPAYGYSKKSRVFQFSAYTFDVSIYDVFTTLCFGGCVCVPSEEGRLDNLVDSMRSMQVNTASLTSTVASLIHPEDVPSLKTLVLLGEPARPTVIEEWAAHSTVLNAYGPAEGCITTLGRLESKEDANNIGYPLSCRVWVTDPTEHNNLNPIGVPGELLIEGPLVARGYLNNPCLTGRSFVVDPIFIRTHGFSTGRRMYRTGDFVRQDWNGALQHLGRIDSQIKIHGQRVEPGEVEYWVKTLCDDVEKASLNLIHPGGDHAKTMLAVAVELSNKSQLYKSTDGVLPLNDELRILLDGMRSALPEKLPAYMVPGVYVPVGKIPQTTSSKVDRRGLCAMLENLGEEQLALYSLGTSVKHAPSTRMEKKLQELWATSLGVSQKSIGVKDDFFRSGGDSLIAMQLVGYCSSNIPLTISDIFKNPRLDRMAALAEEKNSLKTQSDPSLQDLPFTLCPDLCDKRLAEIAEECGVTIDQIEDVYPCTPLQEGLFTVTMRRPHAYMFRQVFRLCSMDIGHFQDAWQVVSQRVPILRTVLVSDDNLCFLQVVLRSPLIWVSGFSLDAYLVSDKKMSIETGRPLSRYAIIEQNEEEKYFIWTAHHSVYDGITLRKIFEMVAQAYMIGNVTLSAVPFKRFVAHLQTPVSGQVRSFWRSQLNGGALAYPQASRIREVRVTERLFNRIRITSGSLPITLSNILRAAWAIVLSRTTRHECIIFGTTLSGRFAPILGIADIVGPTISTVPIQIKVGRQMTVNEYLISVHQQSVDMMAFEYTGLQYIRRLVSPASNLPDLGNLFVVQFPQEQDELMAGFMPGLVPHSVASQEFDSYPLNVFCNLNISKGRAINVEARFDNSIISAEEVDSLMGQLGVVVNHLIKLPPDTKLRDIASISPTKFRSVHGGLGINNLGRLEADGGLQNSSGRYEVTRPTGSQIEKDILAICTSVMGLSTDNTPLERSFSNLGGDSFMAMQLVMRFRRRGIPITVQDIIRSRSITELASSVELLQRSATYTPPRALEEEIDWHGEAAITRLPELSKTHSNGLLEIVLTGSTGFLGHHILGELVAAPLVARIHCIAVRPQGLGSARNLPTISKKIFTYSGDLTLPLLGLSEQHYELFSTCSAIIHCGAHVSFVQPYQALQKANVESTKILADFAVQHKIPFHFISTLGVTHLSRQEIFGEVSVAAHPPNNSGDGYVASKWVSEVFLENINRETGLPVYIYRPSAIVGPGAPTLDIANNLLNFSRKIQSVPDISNWNGRLDCVDITAVATNISRTVLQDSLSRARGVVYYHESGQLVIPYSGMKQYLEREGLVKLKEVSLCEWIALALGSGMHPSVGEYLETSAQKVIEAHPMPLCDTSRDYTDFGRIRV